MALQYGMNITSSDMQKILEQNDKQQTGVRSWQQLLGGASLGYESQADSLKSYYSDATSQAYKSNFERGTEIMGAGLNVGATRDAISANRQDLQQTYDTYIRNYASNMGAINKTSSEEIGAIGGALTERAGNFSNLYNKAYKYLSDELYGSTLTTTGTDPIYETTGKGKNKETTTTYEQTVTNYLDEHDMEWLKDKDGDLLPFDEIMSKMVAEDKSLNERGIQFFDQLFNAMPQGYKTADGEANTRGFGEWLSEADNDLYNWAGGQDLFNYNFAGTNLGTANIVSGRESRDDIYSNTEYPSVKNLEPYALPSHNDEARLTEMTTNLEEMNKAKTNLDAKTKVREDAVAEGATGQYAGRIAKEQWDKSEAGKAEAEAKINADNELKTKLYNEAIAEGATKQEAGQIAIGRFNAATNDPSTIYNKAEPLAIEQWNTYQTEVTTSWNELDKAFKAEVGSTGYSEFSKVNKTLFAEYNTIIEQMKNSKYVDAALARRATSLYDEIYKSMQEFVLKSIKKKKPSGL